MAGMSRGVVALVAGLVPLSACREKPSELSVYEAKVADVVPKIERASCRERVWIPV